MALCPGWWLDLVPLSRREEKHCMAQSEAAQNSKDITMPVIKWLVGEASGHQTAWRKNNWRRTRMTQMLLTETPAWTVFLSSPLSSPPLSSPQLMTKRNSAETLILHIFFLICAEDANSLGLHRACQDWRQQLVCWSCQKWPLSLAGRNPL